MKIRPSGANSNVVGALRPDATLVSTNPLGSVVSRSRRSRESSAGRNARRPGRVELIENPSPRQGGHGRMVQRDAERPMQTDCLSMQDCPLAIKVNCAGVSRADELP